MNSDDFRELDALIEQARQAGDTARADALTEIMVEALRRGAKAEPEGFMASAMQGASFGLADELAGLVSPGATERTREQLAEYRAASPGGAFAGEALGGLGLGLGLGGAMLRGGGRAGQWLTAPRAAPQAAAGALEGGLYGIGTGEGTLAERLPGGAWGAAGGGILSGLAAPAVAAGVRQFSPQSGAEQLVTEALRRDRGHLPGRRDYQILGLTSEFYPQKTLAELSGPNLQELARTAASVPGASRAAAEQVLEARRVSMPERLSTALERATGQRGKYWENLRNLEDQAKTLAGPKYTEAYSAHFLPNEDPGLVELTRRGLDTGDLRRGYKNAWRIARLEGEKLPKWTELLDESGNLRPMDLKTYDWIKRGLDAEYKRLVTSNPALARSVWVYRQQLVDRLDELVPAYGEARQLYAGPMSQREAQQAGRDIFKEDAEYTQDFVSQLSQGEKEAYTLGAVSVLKDRLKNVPLEGGMPRLTQLAADRLRAAFPTQEGYESFLRSVLNEREMAAFRNMVLAGSPTQRIAAAQEDIRRTLGVGGGLRQMLQGDFTSGAQTLLGAMRPPRAATIPERMNERLAPMLFAQGPQASLQAGPLMRPAMVPALLPPITTTQAALMPNLMPDLLSIIGQEEE